MEKQGSALEPTEHCKFQWNTGCFAESAVNRQIFWLESLLEGAITEVLTQ